MVKISQVRLRNLIGEGGGTQGAFLEAGSLQEFEDEFGDKL